MRFFDLTPRNDSLLWRGGFTVKYAYWIIYEQEKG